MSEPKPGSKPDGQRVAPLEPEDWDDRVRRILAPSQSRPLPILTTIAHHPRLFEAFIGFASALTLEGLLPRRDAEILSLRAAWNCRSEFEWGHHRVYALAAGLSESEIEAIAADPDTGDWEELDRTLLRAADELHETRSLSESTFAWLAARYESAQIIELLFTVGQYTTLSTLTNALGIELEPDLKGWP